MKVVVPGGSGHLGQVLTRAFEHGDHEVVVLSRRGSSHGRVVQWDGRTLGSWMSELDGADAVINNLAAPGPLPQREFMTALRAAWRVPVGLPATRRMAELGAVVLRTDTELVLKSRRVIPKRLLDAGFAFEFPEWPAAAADLVARRKRGRC